MAIVVTPNWFEARVLTGISMNSTTNSGRAVKVFQNEYGIGIPIRTSRSLHLQPSPDLGSLSAPHLYLPPSPAPVTFSLPCYCTLFSTTHHLKQPAKPSLSLLMCFNKRASYTNKYQHQQMTKGTRRKREGRGWSYKSQPGER